MKLLDIWSIALSILLCFITLYLIAKRWTFITGQTNIKNYPLAISAYLYSNIFNLITPANVGGDVYKFFYFKEKNSFDILKKLILERIYGLFALTSLGLTSFLYTRNNESVNLFEDSQNFFLFFFIFTIVGLIIYLLSKYIKIFGDAMKELKSVIINDYKSLFYILFYSYFNLVSWSLAIFILSLSFGIDATFNEILFVCLAVELIRIIPISFQGIGVREVSFLFLMTGYGYDAELSFCLGLVGYAILTICLLFSGIFGLFMISKDDG